MITKLKLHCRKITCSILTCVIVFLMPLSVFADKTNQYDYIYSKNFIDMSTAGFTLGRVIDSSYMGSSGLKSADDIAVGCGRIFIADSQSGRVNVLDATNYKFITSIRLIRDKNNKIVTDDAGAQLLLQNPQGVYCSEELNEIYISDYTAERIIVLDTDDYTLNKIITRPSNMQGNTAFRPTKIVADSYGKIYFMVPGSFEGIIELNPNGEFSRYFGVNKPHANPVEYFWKTLASSAQREQMAKTFAPSFSGLDIDKEGFIYAVTNDTASEKMLFRFNAKSENVIREQGYVDLVGDYTRYYVNTNMPSAFVDVAVTDYGVYAVADKTYGRVFVYDFDGYCVTIFGRKGNTKGDFSTPSSICWNGYDLLVADKDLGVVYQYIPTEFGKATLLANEHYMYGRWDEANEMFTKAIELNANYYSAYSGIGRNYLMKHDYDTAMYYFELADDTEGWSQAFEYRRSEIISEYFPIVLVVVLAILGAVIWSEVRYHRKKRAEEK